MEYNTYQVFLDLVAQLKLMNEKMESLEFKFFQFESKVCDLDDKVSRVLEATEGISSSFGDMKITPEQVEGVFGSLGLTGQAGGSELVDTLHIFRSKLGELSSKLSKISDETEKI